MISGNEDVRDVVDRVRKALGPDVQIMGDAFMTLDVETTLRIADGLVDVDLGWFEEPLPADDLAGYARLRDECPISIAGGEHGFTAKALSMHQPIDNNAFSQRCPFRLPVSLRIAWRDLAARPASAPRQRWKPDGPRPGTPGLGVQHDSPAP